jgi:transcriptional regulator of arginine metabolism
MRSRRQRAIAEIIASEAVASQEEVTARLAELGYSVTQATVSRDLERMGAVKVKRGGVLAYTLADQLAESDWAADRLQRIVRDWVLSVEAAGNMIVIKTPPGSAHLVGLALDQSKLPEIAGTVSGDDTLFLVVREGAVAAEVAERFRRMTAG